MVTRNGEAVAEGVDIDFVGVGAVVKSSMNTVLVEIPQEGSIARCDHCQKLAGGASADQR